MGLTVCICTYNRADSLRVTLESLVANRAELDEGDDVLLIDNNSSDHTRMTTDSFTDKLPLRYVFEPSQGLSAARNAALANLDGDAILFIDDDVTMLPGALSAYRQALQRFPAETLFAGPIQVAWQGGRPDWLKSDDQVLLNGLFCHYQPSVDGEEVRWPPHPLLPYGANFLLRRALVDAVGEFDTRLGVRGSRIDRGEETDYFERAMALGHVGRLVPDAEVAHRFPNKRLKIRHLLRYGAAKGRGLDRPNPGLSGKSSRITGFAVNGLWQLIKGRRDHFYQCVINIGIVAGMGSR